jgi:GNAT superfamily N-acetyltransferase
MPPARSHEARPSVQVHEAGTRDAGPGDVPELASMHMAAHGGLISMPRGAPLAAELRRGDDAAEVRSSFEADLHDSDTKVLVGLLGTVTVGYGVLVPDGARGRITELWVEPDAREVGVGTALLEALRAEAAARSMNGLDSVALPGDRNTKNFFEDHAMVARAIVVGTSDL